MPHVNAVFVEQWHDVGNEPERGQSDGVEQKLAQPWLDFLAAAELLTEQPGDFERHAGAGQAAERLDRPRPSRMHDDGGGRQLTLALVVIGDDQFEAQLVRFRGFVEARDAAIDGDDELRAVGLELLKRLRIQPVALFQAVRHVEIRFGADVAESLEEDGRSGHAVGIVVAVHRDAAAGLSGFPQFLSRLDGPRQFGRRTQPRERAFEKPLGLARFTDTAIEQQLRDDRGRVQIASEPLHGARIVRQ